MEEARQKPKAEENHGYIERGGKRLLCRLLPVYFLSTLSARVCIYICVCVFNLPTIKTYRAYPNAAEMRLS